VKRSGRDDSIQVVIHMYMEAMLGISLCSYPHVKLAKTLVFITTYVFSSTKFQVLPESKGMGGERGDEGGGINGPRNVCTYE
jgi:hypothetical protein